MSKPLEGVSEKIETCAKKEFLEKGYVDASLRNIAAKAGTTTGQFIPGMVEKKDFLVQLLRRQQKNLSGCSVAYRKSFIRQIRRSSRKLWMI